MTKKQKPKQTIWTRVLLTCSVAGMLSGVNLFAMQASDDDPQDEAAAVATVDETETIDVRQQRVSSNYESLEQKLLALFEYERDNNPARAKLLKRAFELSQRQGTTEQLKQIVSLIDDEELKLAETNQQKVITDLNKLLTLLQSEDRGKRIEDELKRNQEYLKEVERLIRIQRSLRGQTEGNVDAPRLAKSQKQAADRAAKLADKIRENEEPKPEDQVDSGDSGDSDKAGQAKDSESEDGTAEDESQSLEPKPSDDSQSDPAQDSPAQGSPSSGSSQSGQPSGDAPPAEEMNPVRKRIAAAEDRMRQAKKKLDGAKRENAVEDMLQAERELEAARQELEEILRQLREEEVERTLAQLEGRFRKMLEREIKVKEQTESLNAVVPEQRRADFEIRAGKLAAEQNSIATEASRTLLLLREDGTSIAFPQTVEEMKFDMTQVANRLGESRVGPITIEIESDIIETLGDLIAALADAQKENEDNRKTPPGGGGGGSMSPADFPLVNQLAEIRMLRALQDRIYRRHTRYSKMLADPNDPIGRADDPETRAALRRLTQKQRQLTEIAKEIVAGLSQ